MQKDLEKLDMNLEKKSPVVIDPSTKFVYKLEQVI